jgi:hypothetical protein
MGNKGSGKGNGHGLSSGQSAEENEWGGNRAEQKLQRTELTGAISAAVHKLD